jgi:hypothetical protein
MLTREEAAAWLQVSPRWLALDGARARPMVPVFKLGFRTPRYHPRTIIAALAKRPGLPNELIAASFGIAERGIH